MYAKLPHVSLPCSIPSAHKLSFYLIWATAVQCRKCHMLLHQLASRHTLRTTVASSLMATPFRRPVLSPAPLPEPQNLLQPAKCQVLPHSPQTIPLCGSSHTGPLLSLCWATVLRAPQPTHRLLLRPGKFFQASTSCRVALSTEGSLLLPLPPSSLGHAHPPRNSYSYLARLPSTSSHTRRDG